MITIPKKVRQKAAENPFFKMCCHLQRPDFHKCNGNIVWEHPWSRLGSGDGKFAEIFVPVCEKCNISPDKKTRAWSKLVAFQIYGIAKLRRLNPKKDWEAERNFCLSFFE